MSDSASREAAGRRQLVVNADDFGWSRSVNRGIVHAHESGIVTSASILAAAAGFEDAVELSHETPNLAVGVHLQMYRGRPVLPPQRVRSLIGSDDRFLGAWQAILRSLVVGSVDLDELESEFRAQVERVKAAGIEPTHLDSEKHLHVWPSVFEVVCRVAKEFEIPYVRLVREPFGLNPVPLGLSILSRRNRQVAMSHGLMTPDGTIGVTEAPTTREALVRLLGSGRGRRVEFVVHPGYVDDEFWELQATLPNRLVCTREEELTVLASSEARELVEQFGYSLCGVPQP